MEKSFTAISFDLKQKELDEHYEKHKSSAYREIRDYLKKNGYEHKEGSVYHSNNEISTAKFLKMVEDMNEKFPWLKYCVKEMHRTKIDYREIVDVKKVLEEKNLEQEKKKDIHKNPMKKNPIKEASKDIKNINEIER